MTKIKICGITNAEDARFCEEVGADFLGFVFVRSSPRCVRAQDVARIETRAKRVGVFRDSGIGEIRRIAEIARLDYVQLHGSESEDDVREIELPVIKAVRVENVIPVVNTAAEWVMFDSGGGTGRTFDWKLVAGYHGKKFFLAGGLTPENVVDAIHAVHPDAIDLASGVESKPGVKDHDKVRELFRRVRSA